MDIENFLSQAAPVALNILLAMVVMFIGIKLSGIAANLLLKIFSRTPFDEKVETLITSGVQAVIIVATLITAFSLTGVQTTNMAALIVGLGVAVGGILSGALTDVAAGIQIAVFDLFDVGDRVVVAGQAGVVKEVNLFRTALHTPDKRHITVPNSDILKQSIENWDSDIRVDVTVGVNYGEEGVAQDVFQDIIDVCPYAIVDGDHFARNNGNTAHGIDYLIGIIVKPEHFFDTRFWINEQVLERFNANDLTISLDRLEVHYAA